MSAARVRLFLAVGVALVVAAGGRAQPDIDKLKVKVKLDDKSQRCVKACQDCAKACAACAKFCYDQVRAKPDDREHRTALRFCLDCHDVCAACARVVGRTGPARVALCQVCARVCDECAKVCGKHDRDVMKECARACKMCATACREIKPAKK